MPYMASSLIIRLLLLAISFLPRVWAQCAEDERCVHMQVLRSTNKNLFAKRSLELDLSSRSDVAYYAELSIGTPAQQLYVQLDTGSFELWVNPTCSSLDTADEAFCDAIGFYNTSLSTTASDTDTSKTLSYGIGSADITYFKDDISLPGTSEAMTNVQFGVATSSKSEFSGILGIGYGLGYATKYRNFVDELAYQNQTQVKAFSVALGSKDEEEGVLIFGGVDTRKFSGNLAKLPIISAADSPDGVPRYWISMNSMSLTPPSGQTKVYENSTMDVFLDTGSTLTLLPQDVCDQLGTDFGSDGVDSSGYYYVDCSLADIDGSVNFEFNDVAIEVPYSEFIRSVGDDSCVLGITPSDSFVLLGDTFMRSAYAVFDLETNAIHLQQYVNCGSSPAAIVNASSLSTIDGKCNSSSLHAKLSHMSSPSSSSSTTSTATQTASTASSTATGIYSIPAAAGATPSSSSSASSSSSSSSASAANSVVMTRGSPAALAVAMIMLLALL